MANNKLKLLKDVLTMTPVADWLEKNIQPVASKAGSFLWKALKANPSLDVAATAGGGSYLLNKAQELEPDNPFYVKEGQVPDIADTILRNIAYGAAVYGVAKPLRTREKELRKLINDPKFASQPDPVKKLAAKKLNTVENYNLMTHGLVGIPTFINAAKTGLNIKHNGFHSVQDSKEDTRDIGEESILQRGKIVSDTWGLRDNFIRGLNDEGTFGARINPSSIRRNDLGYKVTSKGAELSNYEKAAYQMYNWTQGRPLLENTNLDLTQLDENAQINFTRMFKDMKADRINSLIEAQNKHKIFDEGSWKIIQGIFEKSDYENLHNISK